MSVYRVGGNKSSQNVFPSVRPTLDLDFANSKTLDPRITFTRASGGSYVGADGLIKYAGVNEARFDHDPSTGESLGLLIEEARTNLLLRSEEFNNGYWSKTRSSVTANAIEAPDGTLTADKLVESALANNTFYLRRNTTLSASTKYSISVYAKAAERTEATIILFGSNGWEATSSITVNLLNGNFTLSGSGATGSVTYVDRGWYKISISQTTDVTTGSKNVDFYTAVNGSTAYTGDGTSGIYLWGAQLEEGSFPTSYIPTQASTRTRAADDASITGKNFSEWYRQDEGTIFAKGKSSSDTDTSTNGRSGIVWLAPLAATLRGIYLTTRKDGNNQIELAVRDDDGATALSTNHILTSGYKVAGSYDKNLGILRFSLDGEPTKIFNRPTLLGFNTTQASLVIGSGVPFGSNTTTRKPNSTISKITYYPRALTPSQIQALTR
jgi:hypothetical protein